MPSAKNALEPAPLQDGPASATKPLSPWGSDPVASGREDLFRTIVNELHEVVEFDVLGQFDSTANWVQWYFAEPYKTSWKRVVWRLFPRGKAPVVYRIRGRSWPASRIRGLVSRRFSIASRNWVSSRLVCSPEHRTSKIGKSRFYQPPRRCILAGRATVLVPRRESDRCGDDDAQAQKRLKLLLNLTSRVVSKLQLPELLQEISASIRQSAVRECSRVSSRCRNGELRRYALDFPGHEEILAMACTDHETAVSGPASRSASLRRKLPPTRATALIHSCCLLPLLGGERAVGVLALGSAERVRSMKRILPFSSGCQSDRSRCRQRARLQGNIATQRPARSRERLSGIRNPQ